MKCAPACTAPALWKRCSSSSSAASGPSRNSTGCEMTRIFRAFLWLRFRVLVNSLERTGARDTLERFSVATEKLGPIIALVLLIPSSLALFVLGITTGFALAQSDSLITITIVRYFLLIALMMTLI